MLFDASNLYAFDRHQNSPRHNFDLEANAIIRVQRQDSQDYILAPLFYSAWFPGLYQDFTRSNFQLSGVMLIYKPTDIYRTQLPSLNLFSFLLTSVILGLLLSCLNFGLICNLAHRPRLIVIAMLFLIGLQICCIGLLGDRLLRLYQQVRPAQLTDSRQPPHWLN